MDSYDELGLQLSFDDDDKLVFVEAFSPAVVTFRSVRLIDRPVVEVLGDLHALDVVGAEDDAGYDFRAHGIGLYAPDQRVDAVSAYAPGYFDDP